jgi:hypothetical protein
MSKHNYWPHTVVLMIIGAVVASVWTIKIAINAPVQDSNLFMNNYHITDKNINEILLSQIEFDKRYSFNHNGTVLTEDNFTLQLNVEGENPSIEATLSRHETDDFDKSLRVVRAENGSFQFETVDIVKAGRLKLLLKVTVANFTKYQILELDTREPENIAIADPFVSNARMKKIEKIRQRAEELRTE